MRETLEPIKNPFVDAQKLRAYNRYSLSYLEHYWLNPQSILRSIAREAAEAGSIDNTDEAGSDLAGDIGTVFFYAVDEATGAEITIEELRRKSDLILQETGLDAERLSLVYGILKSRFLKSDVQIRETERSIRRARGKLPPIDKK